MNIWRERRHRTVTPSDLYWKKDPEAIKECIRRNEHVALTLYRDGMSSEALRARPRIDETLAPERLPLKLAVSGGQV